MLRLTELEAGSISIGGIDICQIPLARLRRAVAYIPQTPFLFEASMAAANRLPLMACMLCGPSGKHAGLLRTRA